MEWISELFEQYGYGVLFLGLFAESLAIPFPGELAMAISGHMAAGGTFHLLWIMLVSYLGAIIGTIVTYVMGRKLGRPFFDKYGKYILLKPQRIDTLTTWFAKYSDKLILVSYFVPGLRHFTGYISGILKVRSRTFFLYNSVSGLIWVILYVMVGYIFGNKIEQLLHLIAQYSVWAVAGGAIVLTTLILVRKNKASLAAWARSRYHRLFKLSADSDR
ncbi:DedA family protein [Paenibacillus sp. FJAT-26967]|uniref:DedA family protein n=1 Tax=Paenibacillus sp. FJAT-26967 TaxID=1729690 RepID=UPI00083851F9|nr:DedA family protein [Paenibacillus sp. FJAT-26967]